MFKTILQGIKNELPNANITYDKGCGLTDSPPDFNTLSQKIKGSEVIIFVGGISARLEGEDMPVSYILFYFFFFFFYFFLFIFFIFSYLEIDGFKGGDRTKIEIPAVQRQLIQNLKTLGFLFYLFIYLFYFMLFYFILFYLFICLSIF
jgi:beta-glucosidase